MLPPTPGKALTADCSKCCARCAVRKPTRWAFCAGWERAVEREARWISRAGAELVVTDIPALAFVAAEQAGVRAVGVGNFGWDWILDAYCEAEPRWAPIVELHRSAYSTADQLFRLPLADEMSAFPHVTDVPLLVNRTSLDVGSCRRAAGIAANERRRIVHVSVTRHPTALAPAARGHAVGRAAAAPETATAATAQTSARELRGSAATRS